MGSCSAPKARIYGMLGGLAGCAERVDKQESMADDLVEWIKRKKLKQMKLRLVSGGEDSIVEFLNYNP